MKTIITHLSIDALLGSCIFFLAFSTAFAQKDTVEFKFIPKYYPEDNAEFIPAPPPQVVHSPKILYPNDPKLQGRDAKVLVKALVDRKGIVRDAQVLKTSDGAFSKYAIKYAKQYTFRWADGWPEEFKHQKNVWIAIPISFRR